MYASSHGVLFVSVVYDSCEYVISNVTDRMAHKGNCRFCKERRQKELEELIIKLKEKWIIFVDIIAKALKLEVLDNV